MHDGLERAADSAARLLLESRHVMALAGSGLSVESGIPTFRGPQGLWTRLGEPSKWSYQRFLDDPAAWWKHQLDREADPARTELRDAIDRARPNPGHYALAELEQLGILKLTVTQNVDDLHSKAGSKLVAEIHGSRTKVRCIGCGSRWPRDGFEIERYPPRCPECNNLIKFDTVVFGEPVPRQVLDRCYEEADRCDCMIAAGTSATVFPAANLPNRVLARGGTVLEANLNHTPLSGRSQVVLRGPAAQTLPLVVHQVRKLLGRA